MKWLLIILGVGGLVWWFYPGSALENQVRVALSSQSKDNRPKVSPLVIKRLHDEIAEIDGKLKTLRADLAEVTKPKTGMGKVKEKPEMKPDPQFLKYSINRLETQRLQLTRELARVQ